METSTASDSFLYDKFQEFYKELTMLKESAIAGTWIYSGDTEETGTSTGAMEFSSNAIFQKLITQIEQQELEAAERGGDFGVALFQEAKFIMAAMADETFLSIDWVGQKKWGDNLLETKIFRSNASGEIFFKRLESLLENNDPVYTNIAMIFMAALSLGFRGKYFQTDDHGKIEQYRKQLFTFAFNKKPELTRYQTKITPSAYDHTNIQDANQEIPGLKKWYFRLYGLTAVLILTSFFIWFSVTSDISQVLQSIL